MSADLRSPGITLVAVHAHPDDETLATGVALAHHASAGSEVHVITATLGEEGEVIPPGLAHLEGSAELGPHRRAELGAAMRTLGVQQEYLGATKEDARPRWRDSGMAGSAAAAHPRAFASADLDETAEVLAARLRALAPQVLITYDPQGGYGHPDHIRTHEVSAEALRRLAPARRPRMYVVATPRSWAAADRAWLREHVPGDAGLAVRSDEEPYPPSVVDDDQVTLQIVDEDAGALRARALRHHATQVRVFDGYYALSNAIAARLIGREGYRSWRLDE